MFKIKMHSEVHDELAALPVSVQGRFIRQLDKLRQNPTVLREPDSKPLGNGLFEIRTIGFFHSRGIYVYQNGKTIWLLRVFVKKTQKTPRAELALATKRLKEMQDEQENY
jgi:phage-related protein